MCKNESPEQEQLQPSASSQHPECSEFSAKRKNTTDHFIWQGGLWLRFDVSQVLHKPWGARWGPTLLIKWGWLCRWRAVGFWGNTVSVLHLMEGWRWLLSGWRGWSSEVWEHTGLEPAAAAVAWRITMDQIKDVWSSELKVQDTESRYTQIRLSASAAHIWCQKANVNMFCKDSEKIHLCPPSEPLLPKVVHKIRLRTYFLKMEKCEIIGHWCLVLDEKIDMVHPWYFTKRLGDWTGEMMQ